MAFSREALWADFCKQEGAERDTAQAGSGRQRVSSSPPSIGPLYIVSVYYRRLVCKESSFSLSIRLYGCLFSSNNFTPHYYGNFGDSRYFYCVYNFYEISLRYKRDEVTGERRKQHDEYINYLYSSPSVVRLIKSRIMIWAGHVARRGARRGVYSVLVGKPEGKGPLGRRRLRWEDNIMMDIQEVVCGGMDLIDLAQDRDRWRALVNAVMNLRVP